MEKDVTVENDSILADEWGKAISHLRCREQR